ncbi:nucleotidyltransferase domain-containing protein [Endozoicomonas montiporae]
MGITPEQKVLLESLLKMFIPDNKVWAYGSRVNGLATESSDLDLVYSLQTSEHPKYQSFVRPLKKVICLSELTSLSGKTFLTSLSKRFWLMLIM